MVHEVLNFVHIKINSRVFSLQQFHIQFFFSICSAATDSQIINTDLRITLENFYLCLKTVVSNRGLC